MPHDARLNKTQDSGAALAVGPNIVVFVGYADNLRPNPNFPVPWQGSPNVVFLGAGPAFDAGGFDLACRGNESLQWRRIGTTGIGSGVSRVVLTPNTSVRPAGTTYTATAQVTDAGGEPLANVVVDFKVTSGPNSGRTGRDTTDRQGLARFTYSSSLVGTDVVQAFVTNITGASIPSNEVTVAWTSPGPCPAPARPPEPSATRLYDMGYAIPYNEWRNKQSIRKEFLYS